MQRLQLKHNNKQTYICVSDRKELQKTANNCNLKKKEKQQNVVVRMHLHVTR